MTSIQQNSSCSTGDAESTKRLPLAVAPRADFLADLEGCLAGCLDGTTGLVLIRVVDWRALNFELGYRSVRELIDAVFAAIEALFGGRVGARRLSEDELALILPRVRGTDHALLAINRAFSVVAEPLIAGDSRVKVSLRAGVAIESNGISGAPELLRGADIALARAQEQRSEYCVFSAELDHPWAATLAADLEGAIHQAQLELFYQPKIALREGRAKSLEGLVRWRREDGTMVRPDVLVSTAERCHLILPLTLATLNIGLRQLSGFRTLLPDLTLAINLSTQLFAEPELVPLIEQALGMWSIEPGALILEVTETMVMSNEIAALETLDRLREIGIRSSIDDFGTGYSSLAYLRRLPVSELKIDRAFVRNLGDSRQQQRIVQAVIDLAHGLDLAVVAEGIEERAAFERLGEMGCEYGQGYYMSKPLPASELSEWLRSSPWAGAADSG
jgi:EAL domain-containing protein (putative c-di-GMP-specific phosphodiesterase class I)/GGDEF domain-containing protein